MNTSIQAIRVGFFFVLGVALIYIVYESLNQQKLTVEEGYELIANFNDIQILAPGDEVRMAGVRIGKVASTSLVDGEAQVVMQIMQQYKVPDDSIASIGVASLLGQNYLGIKYGKSQAFLGAGDKIQTRPSVDFNALLGQVQELGDQIQDIASSFQGMMGGDESGSLFAKLNDMLDENRDKIDNILASMESITQKIDEGEGTIAKLLNDDEAYNELIASVQEIKAAATTANETITEAQDIIQHIKTGEGTIGSLVYKDEISAKLNTAVDNFVEFSENLSQSEGTLGKLINDDELYNDLKGMMQDAQRTLDTMGDSGPVTAVGATAGALF